MSLCREKVLYFSFVVNVKSQIMKALENNIIFNECINLIRLLLLTLRDDIVLLIQSNYSQ